MRHDKPMHQYSERNPRRCSCVILCLLLITPAPVFADTATVTNTLNATIMALGALSAPASTSLTQVGTLFNSYTGTVNLQYRARTTAAGGGSLTLKVTADFPAGGPSVSSGNLSYTCGSASLGTPCGGTTASTTSATQVVTVPSSACTGGGAPCSATDPNTVALTFTLADDPSVKTGSFTASVQFTISAT